MPNVHSAATLQTYGRFTVGDYVATPTLSLKGIRKARIVEIDDDGPTFIVRDQFGDTHEIRFEELDG